MSSSQGSPGIYITETLLPIQNNNTPGEAIGAIAATYNRGPNVPTLISSWSQFTQKYGTFSQIIGSTALHYAVYQFFNNGGSQLYILAVPNTDSTTASLVCVDVNSPPDNVMTIKATSPGTWGDQVYVALTTAGASGRFNYQVYYGGSSNSNLVETFLDLSINPSDPRYVGSIVNSPTYGSSYTTVTVTLPGSFTSTYNPALFSATALAGGGDGSTPPTLSTAVPNAFDMLQGQILNVNVPGIYDATTINALINWAAGRGDTMIIIDGPSPTPNETSAQVVTNYTNLVTGGTPFLASSYATLYAPWIQIPDPASAIPGSAIWVPPGGAVLGIWSRTDTRVGPWQSPAGVSFGKIALSNVEAQFTSTDLGNLNNANINAIRLVPNYFPAVMGARTLGVGYPDRYIAVRRMLIKLEHDFTFLLQPALFEPNNATLWAWITNSINNYLTGLMQRGALGGTNQTNSFNVICNASNNTPATSAAGIVNASVAVAISSPAEFILINVSQFQNTGTTTITTSTGG